uniref:Uncharacterized protein n=1 Tax=Anguilla anguilla TaxID=7936 RepID=A0A0E9QZ34_ANGAN
MFSPRFTGRTCPGLTAARAKNPPLSHCALWIQLMAKPPLFVELFTHYKVSNETSF